MTLSRAPSTVLHTASDLGHVREVMSTCPQPLRKLVAAAVSGCLLACSSGAAPTASPVRDAGAAADLATGRAANGGCPSELDAAQCMGLSALIQPLALPPALGNASADDDDAAVLGFQIFFDIRFSRGRKVRCESCHSVDYAFADNAQVPTLGLGPGVRNSPTVLNAARHTIFMWDGRADTLWSQPLLAFENPDEMGFTRLEIAHTLQAFYASMYQRAFGPLPDFSDRARFPAAGMPGDAAFDAMRPEDQRVVDQTVANVGKALEAYMRKLATGPSRVDRYLASLFDADPGYPPLKSNTPVEQLLSAEEQRGAVVFARSGCLACHSGSQLSDDQFHDLGVPALPGHAPDPGRTPAVVELLASSPFNASGVFFEGTPGATPPPAAAAGAFRTPSLRNLTRSRPYGHNGVFASLEDVVDFHLAGGGQDPDGLLGEVDPLLRPQQLSAADRAALIAFLKALDGMYPALPWGQWPSGNG